MLTEIYNMPVMHAQAKTDIQAGDDDFEAYRKRMMLGYKHRCAARTFDCQIALPFLTGSC